MNRNPYNLARDEVELINPKTMTAAFELLRAYHSAEWIDDRCPSRCDSCAEEYPPLRNVGSEAEPHLVACHLAD